MKINVRVIAATNRDLEKEVREGRFRPDLYYRLSVFPILIPPLRQRRDDIPALVAHFVEKIAKQVGRPVPGIKQTDMQRLMEHEWKGNIRELEHVIEQAVIVSDATSLNFSGIFPATSEGVVPVEMPKFRTLKEFEKEMSDIESRMILDALEKTGGRVSGKGGAAELLDINPKTLFARMQKLG
ncbi:MAG: sigma-54-dependent Fis family transcriptional regulator, partial [Chlorobiales bacterium]|nr:sigma-54-dependent Fis family transcriptional regulator [Chlorobiales bacterium]